MIARTRWLVVTAALLVACAPLPGEEGPEGLDVEASALTPPSPPPPVPIAWVPYGAPIDAIDIAACGTRLYILTSFGIVKSADALSTIAPTSWRDEFSSEGATKITCSTDYLAHSNVFAITTATGATYLGGARVNLNRPKLIDFKFFTAFYPEYWSTDPFGGYYGTRSSSGVLTWTRRNSLSSLKRTAAANVVNRYYVVAINQDNTFSLSRDGGRSFGAMVGSSDSAAIAPITTDLEATFGREEVPIESPPAYLFALTQSSAGTRIYRGIFTP